MLFVLVPKNCMVLAAMLDVEVLYVGINEQHLEKLQVTPGTILEDAIHLSGILKRCPEIDLTVNPVGIFSKKKALDTVLEAGDRVEIYRPLVIDPMQRRRIRARK